MCWRDLLIFWGVRPFGADHCNTRGESGDTLPHSRVEVTNIPTGAEVNLDQSSAKSLVVLGMSCGNGAKTARGNGQLRLRGRKPIGRLLFSILNRKGNYPTRVSDSGNLRWGVWLPSTV